MFLKQNSTEASVCTGGKAPVFSFGGRDSVGGDNGFTDNINATSKSQDEEALVHLRLSSVRLSRLHVGRDDKECASPSRAEREDGIDHGSTGGGAAAAKMTAPKEGRDGVPPSHFRPTTAITTPTTTSKVNQGRRWSQPWIGKRSSVLDEEKMPSLFPGDAAGSDEVSCTVFWVRIFCNDMTYFSMVLSLNPAKL